MGGFRTFGDLLTVDLLILAGVVLSYAEVIFVWDTISQVDPSDAEENTRNQHIGIAECMAKYIANDVMNTFNCVQMCNVSGSSCQGTGH